MFFALLVFGLIQARTRTVGKVPALLLPFGMIALSLSGINFSFGLRPVPMLARGIALTFTAVVRYVFFRDKRIHYKAIDRKYFIPGSWIPLAVMMAIFFAKYIYAVMNALKAEAISTTMFISVVSAIYGLLSGYFASRAVTLIKQAQTI